MGQKSRDKNIFDSVSHEDISGPRDRRTSDLLLVYEDKTLILFGKPKKNSLVKKIDKDR